MSMNQNDNRINAYKRAAGFQPKKMTSEEAAKTNAAIEALLRPQTESIITQLQTGKKQEPESEENTFKPMNFDSAPVFRSKTQDDFEDENQQKERKSYRGDVDPAVKAKVGSSQKAAQKAYSTSVPSASRMALSYSGYKKSTRVSLENEQNDAPFEKQTVSQKSEQVPSQNIPVRSGADFAQTGSIPAQTVKQPLQPVSAKSKDIAHQNVPHEIIPPVQKEYPENQFDFAAFAARNGGAAFQPKKFSARPLDSLAQGIAQQPVQRKTQMPADRNIQGSSVNEARKPVQSSVSQKNVPGVQSDDSASYETSFKMQTAASSTPRNTFKPDNSVLFKIPVGANKDNAYRRVAKFLLLIGVEDAAKVIAHLPPDQVDKIVPEIASVRTVSDEEAAEVIAEFEHLIQQTKESGGVSTARTILEKAFGEDRASEMLQKTVPYNGGKPFDYLQDIDGDRLTLLLKDESAPVKALVLSQVKPAAAAAVINKMSDIERKEIVQRLAKLTSIAPDILNRIDKTMREKYQTLEVMPHDSIDGRGALAEILRKMDPVSEKNILANLSNSDSELEGDLRKRLFTIDDVINADDVFIQKKLNTMPEHEIAVLICGKKDDFRKKIISNISKGRGASVIDEELACKPFTKKESDTVTNSFITYLRESWEKGDLIIRNRDEDEWVE